MRLQALFCAVSLLALGVFIAPANATTCQSGGKVFNESDIVWSKHHRSHLYCAGNNQWRYLAHWALTDSNNISIKNAHIGIGTSSPSNSLEIWGTGNVDDDVDIRSFGNPAWDQAGSLKFRRYGGTPQIPLAINDGDRLGGISFYGYTGTTSRKSAAIYVDAAANYATTGNADVKFETYHNNVFSEKMRLTGDGIVAIGMPARQANPHRYNLQVNRGILSEWDNTKGLLGALHVAGKNPAAQRPHYSMWAIYNMNEYGGSGGHSGLEFWEYYDADNNGMFCDDTPEITPGGTGSCHPRMIIAPGGNVGIGTTKPQYPLHIVNDQGYQAFGAAKMADIIMYNKNRCKSSGNDEGTDPLGYCDGMGRAIVHQSGDVLSINYGGDFDGGTLISGPSLTVTGTAYKPGGGDWAATSDARLKDIGGDYQKGLQDIIKLSPKVFRYKKNNPRNEPSDKDFVGLIAQDAMQVMPEIVNKDQDGYYSLDSTAITYALINAVRELDVENNMLKTRIEALEKLIMTKQDP